MTDNKKPTNEEIKNEKAKNEELTDEQANEAAGGYAGNVAIRYTCNGCHQNFYGRAFVYKGRSYCANCRPVVGVI